jgi:hypothetical protein
MQKFRASTDEYNMAYSNITFKNKMKRVDKFSYLLPFSIFVFTMHYLSVVKKINNGKYWFNPNNYKIRRLVFYFKPFAQSDLQRKQKDSLNRRKIKLFYWEIHIVLYSRP